MPESLKMILILTAISGVAALGLSGMNSVTEPLIAENERLFTLRSINRVIPETDAPDPCEDCRPAFDNEPDQDAVCVQGFKVYRGRSDGEVVGVAVEAVGEKAYSGTIMVLVGLSLDGTVTGVEVLRHAETPGLGAKITDCEWRRQLVGEGPGDIAWKVTKDGGDVDQISGATISSRSMIDAITKAQELVLEHEDEILSAEPIDPKEGCNAG